MSIPVVAFTRIGSAFWANRSLPAFACNTAAAMFGRRPRSLFLEIARLNPFFAAIHSSLPLLARIHNGEMNDSGD
jgi:hypothetical protein